MQFSYVNANEIEINVKLSLYDIQNIHAALNAIDRQNMEWMKKNELDAIAFGLSRLLGETGAIIRTSKKAIEADVSSLMPLRAVPVEGL